MTAPTHTLQVSGLKKSYPLPSGELPILNGAELSLHSGEAVAITGPSGSGKSTLLYIVGLLDQPTGGNVYIDQAEPLKLSATEQAQFRCRHLGFVFQDHHLLPQCTVLENVLLPALALGKVQSEQDQRAKMLLERVGLKDRIEHFPSQLSGGERQRAAVCRALINKPWLLLADEPTGNLDRKTADVIGSLLLEMAVEQQAMLLCVTHSQDLANRLPRRFELVDGKLVQA